MKKKYWYTISAMIISFIIGLNIIIPILTGKNAIDYLMDVVSDTDEIASEVSDDPIDNTSAAYDYWYAPENSFGISETKSVNWSYFKQLFLAHTDWMLEYKLYDYSEWTDGSDYLTIDRTWNDTGFWKFNLILDVPVDIYSARFTFGIDLPCLDYVERSGHEVWVNYTANKTETYSCMFNWSDIASISNLTITKGRNDDMFWFRFRRDDISAGHYEFDPWFGNNTIGGNNRNIEDVIVGSRYTMGPISGTADSITAHVSSSIVAKDARCMIYDTDKNLIGTTNEVSIPGDNVFAWRTFTFAEPKPILTANTEYNLTVFCEMAVGGGLVKYYITGGNGMWEDTHVYGAPPNPWVPVLVGADDVLSIYCNYTEGVVGNPPIQTNPYIWDGTTQHNMNTTCIQFPPTSWNVTINDPEGDLMNITVLTNESGAWTVVNQTTGSGLSNGSYNFTNVSWVDTCGTKYWISYNVTDGTDWRNITHYFTTVYSPTIHVVYPTNNSVDIPVSPTCHIYANDSCGLDLDIFWYENTSGTYDLVQTNLTVGNNTQHNFTYVPAFAEGTKYYWRVAVNNSYCNTTETFDFTTEIDAVTITRVSYSPANIRVNTTSPINILFNVTTGSTGINQSSLLIAHTVNQTTAGYGYNFTYRILRDSVELRSMNRDEDRWFEKFNAITGTGEIGYYGEWGVHDNSSAKFNVVSYGSNWTTVRFDGATLVPHLFSNIWYIDRTDMHHNSSGIFDIYGTTAYKTNFNMTGTEFYDDNHYNDTLYQFYYNCNDTGTPGKPLKVYLYNESYTSGKPSISDYCVLIDEQNDNAVADYLADNSSYWGMNFSTNNAGYVGTLKMTSEFGFIFITRAGTIANKYDLAYCDTNTSGRDFNNSQFVEYSSNNGLAWSTQNGTIDCHLKYAKLDNTSRLEYKVYANDTSGNEAWSTIYTDLIDVVNVPPNPADILTQNGTVTEYTVGDIVNITYKWIGDPNQEVCWVNTTCHNETHVIIAYIENRSITHAEVEINMSWYIGWNTILVTPGDFYHINITITDPYGLVTGSESNGTFNLSQWYDIETWNGSIYNISTHNTVNDWNGSIYNTSKYNDIETWNGSIYNLSVYSNVETWNGSIYNLSYQNTIDTWNGSIYNISLLDWDNNISIWNGSIYNTSTHNTIDTWNGSIYNTSIPEWTDIETWNGSIYNLSVFEINITKVGNISTVDPINATLGVNVNYTFNITNTGTAKLTNITMNETWFNCSCSNWNFTFISTNLTGGISNITWYNDSCYAILNITNLSVGERYSFNMIINVTGCAVNTIGYMINYANVSSFEDANASASHNITWESPVFAEYLRVRARHPFAAIETNANLLFTVIGILLMVISILAIAGVVYFRYK